jgi:hypothetical protein
MLQRLVTLQFLLKVRIHQLHNVHVWNMNTSTTQCTCMKHEYINYTMYMYETLIHQLHNVHVWNYMHETWIHVQCMSNRKSWYHNNIVVPHL